MNNPIRNHSLYRILRPLIFKCDPEAAHRFSISLLSLASRSFLGRHFLNQLFPVCKPGPQVHAFGLTFSNPLGMAAGYDKEGTAWRGLACLGFGHVEIGTVTPLPQPGNPKPRVFRLIEDDGIINHMGIPGKGCDFMLKQIQIEKPSGFILGINIGKNTTTQNKNAAADCVDLIKKFAPFADYLAVNVSCPNVEDMRSLQDRAALAELLKAIVNQRTEQVKILGRHVPILIKLSPDLEDGQLDEALDLIQANHMDGVIIGNTSIHHDGLKSPKACEAGGLSGRPLRELNTSMVKKVYSRTGGQLPIVAIGGVMNTRDAQEKLDAGAVLVQLYTGLIYEGPGLVAKILNEGLKTNNQ